jgi:uncharacterized protein (DUF2062 family)
MALGVFIGLTPTIPFWYLIQYEIGRTLLGMTGNPFLVSDYGVLSILEAGWHILYPLLVGGLLTAAFFVIPSYFITLHTVRIVRKRNAEPAEPSA